MKTNPKNPLLNRASLFGAALPAVLSIAFAASAHASTYDWSGATDGNMSGTPANWGGTDPTGTDIARWNSASYTTAPTANANMIIGQLLFDAGNTGGVTFGAGTSTLTLNGVSGTGIQMNSGSGAVSTGSAKFALGASQSWINNDDSLLTVTGTITNADNLTAKILTIDGTGNTTLSGVISNGGSTGTTAITKNGTGTLAIGSASNNTFTGGLTLNAGTVSFGNTGSLGSGNVTVAGGNFVNTGGAITSSTVTGWTLNSDLTFGVSAGAWNTGTGAVSLGAANIAINNNNTGTARALTVGGNITGTSNLTLNTGGTSTTTLTSANNTGTITVLGSTSSETFTNITTMGSNVTSLTMGSANSGSTTTVSNIVVNSAGTTLSNNMTAGSARALKILSGFGTTSSGTGDLTINNNATVGSQMVQTGGGLNTLGTLNHNGNLTFGGTGSASWGTFNNNIGANVDDVTKSHSQIIQLNGVNSHTGNTTVSLGQLQIAGSITATTNVIANTGGTLLVDYSNSNTIGLGVNSGNPTNKINSSAGLILGGGTLEVKGQTNKVAVTAQAWTAVQTSGLPSGQYQMTTSTTGTPFVTGQPVTGTGLTNAYVVRVASGIIIVASDTAPLATGSDLAAAAYNPLSSQSFASTTLNAGASAVTHTLNSGSGTAINLNAITRNAGSTLTFTLPATPSPVLSLTNGILTSTGTASTTLLDSGVAYATYNTSDWAAKDSTNAWIVKAGTDANTATTLGANSTTASGINTTLAADSNPITMRHAINEVRSITATGYTITTGGILVAPTTGALTITGGTLRSSATAANKDLVLINNGANALTINSTIANAAAGATGLTKSGTGTVNLGGNNTYTGNTIINKGTLSLTTNTSLDDTSGIVIGKDSTAILNLNFVGTENVASLTINGVAQPNGPYSSSDPSLRITGGGTLNVSGAPPATPYDTWAATFLPADVTDPAGDNDNDGLVNQEEFAFGLSPVSGSSVNPITVPLDKTAGTFTYQRRTGTGLTYKVWTSPDLAFWTVDTGAVLPTITPAGANETVAFTLTGTKPLTAPKLFVRVSAE